MAQPLTSNSFNSQPPEGGWPLANKQARVAIRFNSQPPEGGWHHYGRNA